MKITITLETGEHITGDLYAIELRHDHSDTVKRAQVEEIDSIEIDGMTPTVMFPE